MVDFGWQLQEFNLGAATGPVETTAVDALEAGSRKYRFRLKRSASTLTWKAVTFLLGLGQGCRGKPWKCLRRTGQGPSRKVNIRNMTVEWRFGSTALLMLTRKACLSSMLDR